MRFGKKGWWLLGFFFLFGISIALHELGHALVADRCGVHVQSYCVGVGPKICQFRVGETDCELRGVPFAGQVCLASYSPLSKMESYEQEAFRRQQPEQYKKAADRSRFLAYRSLGTRLLIGAAGPAANLLFGVLLVFAAGLLSHKTGRRFRKSLMSTLRAVGEHLVLPFATLLGTNRIRVLGPIGLLSVSGEEYESYRRETEGGVIGVFGRLSLLWFGLNMFPSLPLDGGVMLFDTLQAAFGPFSEFLGFMIQYGLYAPIIMLLALVFYEDIADLVHRTRGNRKGS